MSLTKLSLAENNFVSDIPAGAGKIAELFLQFTGQWTWTLTFHCRWVVMLAAFCLNVAGYMLSTSFGPVAPEVTVMTTLYTVKTRFASFPSPAGMSLPNSPWAEIMTS
jgi:hypothetical protein